MGSYKRGYKSPNVVTILNNPTYNYPRTSKHMSYTAEGAAPRLQSTRRTPSLYRSPTPPPFRKKDREQRAAERTGLLIQFWHVLLLNSSCS